MNFVLYFHPFRFIHNLFLSYNSIHHTPPHPLPFFIHRIHPSLSVDLGVSIIAWSSANLASCCLLREFSSNFIPLFNFLKGIPRHFRSMRWKRQGRRQTSSLQSFFSRRNLCVFARCPENSLHVYVCECICICLLHKCI